MPPAKKLTAAVGGGCIRSVRAAARKRNESVDTFVRQSLWWRCMGWIDHRRVVLDEAGRVVAKMAADLRGAALAAFTPESRDRYEAQANALADAGRAIHGLPSRRRNNARR